jgi:Respiratory-chain NADH dehydrogenase, 49 Kd subunit
VDTEERAAFNAAAESWIVRGEGIGIEFVPPGTLRTEEMILNIGPGHPSTHGVLRIILELDGEVIVRAQPVIGYMHRGAEKLAEYRDVRQVLVLMNRHDWLSAFNNELGWVLAVERLAGIEVPERASWIRTMLAEWDRVLNHLMFTGSFPLELGAITPMFYAFIERELVQGLMESATGSRMHFSYIRPGGLRDDLPRGWLKRSAEVLEQVREKLEDFENLVMGNEIVVARTRGIGVISPEMAISYGCSGPTLQGSGVPMDMRKDEPYAMYGEVEFDVPVGRKGDSYDRRCCLACSYRTCSRPSARSSTSSATWTGSSARGVLMTARVRGREEPFPLGKLVGQEPAPRPPAVLVGLRELRHHDAHLLVVTPGGDPQERRHVAIAREDLLDLHPDRPRGGVVQQGEEAPHAVATSERATRRRVTRRVPHDVGRERLQHERQVAGRERGDRLAHLRRVGVFHPNRLRTRTRRPRPDRSRAPSTPSSGRSDPA